MNDISINAIDAGGLVAHFTPPELSVVIPTFKERENIASLYQKISVALKGTAWEMIVVDDDSPDGTAEAVKMLGRQHSNIRCIKRIGRRGLSSACIEGILSTTAPFVAVMDADHQHDEAILPQMLVKAQDGAELVVGSRFAGQGSADKGFSATRLWGSNLATRLSSIVAGRHVTDPMSGFFLVRRAAFERVAPKLAADGFKILLDLIVTAGRTGAPLTIAEVPYTFRSRNAGESKMSPLIAIQFLGLFLSKLSGGLLPTSFLLFAMVGASGVAVHLATLSLATGPLHSGFVVGQIIATLAAMTWNFFLNNVLTYSDRRLRGVKLWTGLIGFYLVCSLGGIANVSVASMIYDYQHATLVAGLAGAVMSSVFNYAVTRMITWK